MKYTFLYPLLIILYCSNTAINCSNSNIQINKDGTVIINGKTYYSSNNKKQWYLSPSTMINWTNDLNYKVLFGLSSLLFWEWFFTSFFPQAVQIRNYVITAPIKVSTSIYNDLIKNKELRKKVKELKKNNFISVCSPDKEIYSFNSMTTNQLKIILNDQNGKPIETNTIYSLTDKSAILNISLKKNILNLHLTDINSNPIEIISLTHNNENGQMYATANITMQPQQIYPNFIPSAPSDIKEHS